MSSISIALAAWFNADPPRGTRSTPECQFTSISNSPSDRRRGVRANGLEACAKELRDAFSKIVGRAQIFSEEAHLAGHFAVHYSVGVACSHGGADVHLGGAHHSGQLARGLASLLK